MRPCPTCFEQFAAALRYCPCDGAALGPDDPLIGELLHGQFRVDELVGKGASGNVYRAHQVGVERVVAVKVMHKDAAASSEFCARFMQEARAAAHLSHPGIITVFNVGRTAAGLPFMAMEWVEGRALGRGERGRESLSQSEIIDLAKQIASALVEAHGAGVIHRDLKPDNILVTHRSGQRIVKILDFGIAKVLGAGPIAAEAHLTRQGVVYGTPQYLSPEQASGQEVDERSDLYSLGIMLYELLSGALPFQSTGVALLVDHLHTEAPDIARRVPNLSPALASIVMDLLAKEANKRPASASVLLARLQRLEDRSPPLPLFFFDDASSEIASHRLVRRPGGRAPLALVGALLSIAFLLLGSSRLVGSNTSNGVATRPAHNANSIEETAQAGPQRALMVAAAGYALRVLMPEELRADREEFIAIEIWSPDGRALDADALILVFVDAEGVERGVSVPQSATAGRYVLSRSFNGVGIHSLRILPEQAEVDLQVQFEVEAAQQDPNS